MPTVFRSLRRTILALFRSKIRAWRRRRSNVFVFLELCTGRTLRLLRSIQSWPADRWSWMDLSATLSSTFVLKRCARDIEGFAKEAVILGNFKSPSSSSSVCSNMIYYLLAEVEDHRQFDRGHCKTKEKERFRSLLYIFQLYIGLRWSLAD